MLFYILANVVVGFAGYLLGGQFAKNNPDYVNSYYEHKPHGE